MEGGGGYEQRRSRLAVSIEASGPVPNQPPNPIRFIRNAIGKKTLQSLPTWTAHFIFKILNQLK